MESHGKKVYINPNFNRVTGPKSFEAAVHVNPAFSLNHNFASTSRKPRIHVNPNFVKMSQHDDEEVKATEQHYRIQNNIVSRNGIENVQECKASAAVSSKSRYSLVRTEQQKPVKKDISVKQKSTIAISKYKSVPVIDIQRNLSRTQLSTSIIQLKSKAIPVSEKYNKFKFTRQPVATVPKDLVSIATKTNVQRSLAVKKSLPLTVSKYKLSKGATGKLKKNNMPCPLFRKYGKCLRKDHGKCDYLHDKKHVSLCRKFLKGLCYNEECLFSHDLTTKKMPTCHFYLKGMCSKDNCPYLHVKLNENSKLCADFLKGYCEKGSECLNRHINMCPNMENKRQPKQDSTAASRSVDNRKIKVNDKTAASIKNKPSAQEIESFIDNRYYMDSLKTTESNCEIKPTRCKIGTLPSFIKL